MGLALSPKYRRNRMIYAYLTTARDNRIVRFQLGERPKPILTGLERATFHNGGRIAFGPDGMLYAGVGDAGDESLAQDRDARNGKILRIEPDGDIPGDNPFRRSPVWSLGHRNVQGLAWDRDGRLWATEFGQDRRDEVNLIRRAAITAGPLVEGRGDTQGGKFTNPEVTWSTDRGLAERRRNPRPHPLRRRASRRAPVEDPAHGAIAPATPSRASRDATDACARSRSHPIARSGSQRPTTTATTGSSASPAAADRRRRDSGSRPRSISSARVSRLDDDIALTRTGEGAWDAAIAPGWHTPRGPLGGYVLAILMRGLELAVDDAERSARSVTAHFLRVARGRARCR